MPGRHLQSARRRIPGRLSGIFRLPLEVLDGAMDSDDELEQEAHEPPDEDQSPDVVETDPTGRYSRVSRLSPPTPPSLHMWCRQRV